MLQISKSHFREITKNVPKMVSRDNPRERAVQNICNALLRCSEIVNPNFDKRKARLTIVELVYEGEIPKHLDDFPVEKHLIIALRELVKARDF